MKITKLLKILIFVLTIKNNKVKEGNILDDENTLEHCETMECLAIDAGGIVDLSIKRFDCPLLDRTYETQNFSNKMDSLTNIHVDTRSSEYQEKAKEIFPNVENPTGKSSTFDENPENFIKDNQHLKKIIINDNVRSEKELKYPGSSKNIYTSIETYDKTLKIDEVDDTAVIRSIIDTYFDLKKKKTGFFKRFDDVLKKTIVVFPEILGLMYRLFKTENNKSLAYELLEKSIVVFKNAVMENRIYPSKMNNELKSQVRKRLYTMFDV